MGLYYFFIGEDENEETAKNEADEEEQTKTATIPAVAMRDHASKALAAYIIPAEKADIDWTAKQLVSDIAKWGYANESGDTLGSRAGGHGASR